MKDRAEAARAQADNSARWVEDRELRTRRQTADQPESLRKCYREAARLLHPDLVLDPNQKRIRERLMAKVNHAYSECDEERIRRILSDWQASPDNVEGDGFGAELVRVIRKVAQVKARLAAIATEMEHLRASPISELKFKIEEARSGGLDLLAQMAAQLDERIGEARRRLGEIREGKVP